MADICKFSLEYSKVGEYSKSKNSSGLSLGVQKVRGSKSGRGLTTNIMKVFSGLVLPFKYTLKKTSMVYCSSVLLKSYRGALYCCL